MEEFEERVASKSSLSKRKLVQGKGVNDAWYIISYKNTEGNKVRCPYYSRWKNMLERCYSKKYQEARATYIGCSVSEDWLLFSNFRKWMEKPDNKVYREDACIFVSSKINLLLVDCGATRGDYVQGVSLHKMANKYSSQCAVNGKKKHLGLFNTEREAELTYCKFKVNNNSS